MGTENQEEVEDLNRNRALVLATVGVLAGVALLLVGWDGSTIIWGACVPPANFTGTCGSPEPWLATYSGYFFLAGVAVIAVSVGGAAYSSRGRKV